MNALWFFIISILSAVVIAVQSYVFTVAASQLTAKLRTISFHAILRQDIQFFDRVENNTGILTSRVNDDPQKINGLAGTTLGAIIQAATTLIGGSAIGFVYAWKPVVVGIACNPLVFFAGYIRLVSQYEAYQPDALTFFSAWLSSKISITRLRTMILPRWRARPPVPFVLLPRSPVKMTA